MAKFEVSAAVRSAFDFSIQRAAGVFAPLTLFAVSGVALALIPEDTPDPPIGLIFGALIAGFVGWTMGGAGLMRLALARTESGDPDLAIGPLGLQWNAQEWRFLAAMILAGLAVLVPSALWSGGSFAFGALIVMAGVGGEAMAWTPAVVAVVGALLIVVYLGVRLSLAGPATLATKSITLGSGLTTGAFWPVLGAWILVYLLMVGAALAITAALTLGIMFGFEQADLQASASMAGDVAGVLAQAYVMMPLSAGLAAYLYRALASQPEALA